MNPTDSDAFSWREGGKLLLAVRAQEAGKSDEFTHLDADARADFAKALEVAQGKPTMAKVYAIVGGSFTVFADRFPAGLRREAWTASQENHLALRSLQKTYFDQIPVHMRGEILSGLALAAQRLGDTETATQRLNKVIEIAARFPIRYSSAALAGATGYCLEDFNHLPNVPRRWPTRPIDGQAARGRTVKSFQLY